MAKWNESERPSLPDAHRLGSGYIACPPPLPGLWRPDWMSHFPRRLKTHMQRNFFGNSERALPKLLVMLWVLVSPLQAQEFGAAVAPLRHWSAPDATSMAGFLMW